MRKKAAELFLARLGAPLGSALQRDLSYQSSPQIPLQEG